MPPINVNSCDQLIVNTSICALCGDRKQQLQCRLRNITRLTWVGIGEERADREEDLGDGEDGRPVILQNV